MATGSAFGAAVRGEFLLEPGLAFLNHGSFGATPAAVLAAREGWSRRWESDPVRFHVEELSPRMRALAAQVGRFLGAPPDELVFVDNASSGVSAVVRSLDFAPGDVIVTTNLAYLAVTRALAHVAGRARARVHTIVLPFPAPSREALVEAFVSQLPDRAALAVIDHVTSATGLVLPIAELVRACAERGIPTLVDGAHVPGMFPVDVDAIGADFWTGNLHKWAFAPKGCAALHVRRRWHDRVRAPTLTNGNVGTGLAAEFDYQGTRDPGTWLASGDALDWADRLGWERIWAHNRALRAELAATWCDAFGVAAPAPDDLLGTLATLPMPDPGVDPVRLQHELRERHRIQAMFPVIDGASWFRVSAQIYVVPDDLRRLIDVLRR